MIGHVSIRNYRSLREVDFDLSRLTVLVGANGSGKSNVLRALNPWENLRSHLAWRKTAEPISIDLTIDGERVNRRGDAERSPPYQHQALRLSLDTLRQPNTLAPATRLSERGDNLANLIHAMGRRRAADLSAEFCKLVPMFADVDLHAAAEGQHRLVFQDRWKPDLWFTAEEVSDGTLLMLAYLVLPYQPQPPDVITIEEPERGLHPYLLSQLIDVLRALSEGRIGPRPVQVVAATHSAELLDHLRADEVRFVQRSSEDGATVVTAPPTDSPAWERAFRSWRESLGSLWLSGTLGGVPGR